MGGAIRKDMTSKVTHLICNKAGGEKYQYAMTFRLSVVRPDWVYNAWENRDVPNFSSISNDFIQHYGLKAFEGQKICFFGFNSEDHANMVKMLHEYGGIETNLEDPECSHVVSTRKKNFCYATPKCTVFSQKYQKYLLNSHRFLFYNLEFILYV